MNGEGYAAPVEVDPGEVVTMLTPVSTARAIAADYVPQVTA